MHFDLCVAIEWGLRSHIISCCWVRRVLAWVIQGPHILRHSFPYDPVTRTVRSWTESVLLALLFVVCALLKSLAAPYTPGGQS